MTIPTNRQLFKEYCLRNLGSPVINIEVDDEQIEDRIDQALKYYQDYHFDGAQKVYLKHQVTQEDSTRKYIEISDEIIGIVRVIDISPIFSASSLFDIRYQYALNEMFNIASTDLTSYYLALQHIELISEFFGGLTPMRFNRHTNKLYIDTDWTRIPVGSYIVAECYAIVDPDYYTNVWSDRWLQKYATALIKRQWGTHLKKFTLTLPGNVQYNGQQIYDEAVAEIKELEDEMIDSYSLPVTEFYG